LRTPLICLLGLLAMSFSARGADTPEADGFVPLFNGKDLAGWVPVNVAPNTFTVKEGVIHSTGVPTGIMRTERQYENFVIELDWMHEKPKGNAGLFLWGAPMTAPGTPFAKGIEIQILDEAYVEGEARAKHLYTGQGDVFSIHGAHMKPDRPHPAGWERCLPSEDRTNPAGQWNHYRVEAINGTIKLAVNGKVVSGASECTPRKGYLCLESEGSPAQFKNIRIKELPTNNPPAADVQPEAQAFQSLYTGVDLSGWKVEAEQKGHWAAKDWTLVYDGKADGEGKTLWTEKEYGDFEMIVDWRLVGKADAPPVSGQCGIVLRGPKWAAVTVSQEAGKSMSALSMPGSSSMTEMKGSPARKPGDWNRLIVTVKGGDVTAKLNDVKVLSGTASGIPPRGAIGLSGSGPIQFASVFLRELKD
jgi:hypothetical protein